jgi:hypothetical protein
MEIQQTGIRCQQPGLNEKVLSCGYCTLLRSVASRLSITVRVVLTDWDFLIKHLENAASGSNNDGSKVTL